MKRYDIRNPDDREYLEHVVLSSADLVADAPSAVGLTEALRGHELVSAREFLAEGGAA